MTEHVSDTASTTPNSDNKNAHIMPLLYLKESDVFGLRKPGQDPKWLQHSELYVEIGKVIEHSHIKGLQKIRGMWRIYVDSLDDKVKLMASGAHLRGKRVSFLSTNPGRLNGEQTTRVRVKHVPLSEDDTLIERVLTFKGCDVISLFREKLRIDNKLTTCETGDRLVIIKSSSLKEPLPQFMYFGFTRARVIHPNQNKPDVSDKDNPRPKQCTKCLLDGHVFSQCPNDWVCRQCNKSGHRASDCNFSNTSDTESESDESQISQDPIEAITAPTPKHNSCPPSPTLSNVGCGRGSLLQKSMEGFLTPNLAPNKDKPRLVQDRSPPTPVEDYREKCEKQVHKKRNRNKYTNLLELPQVRTSKYGSSSFRHAAPVLWNALPESFRKAKVRLGIC